MTVGALKTQICLNALPTINCQANSMHNAADNSEYPTIADIPPLLETAKVLFEDDIIGHPASITYHDCPKQLSEYLPFNMCIANYLNIKEEYKYLDYLRSISTPGEQLLSFNGMH